MDLAVLNTLTALVEHHCGEHGQVDADEFDRMLISLNIIEHIPSVGRPGRREHTGLRDRCRQRVMKRLKLKNLMLVTIGNTRSGIYRIVPLRVGMAKRLERLPSDQERIGLGRVKSFVGSVLENMAGAAEAIGRLTPEQWQAVRTHLEGSVLRSAQEIRSTINVVLMMTDIPEKRVAAEMSGERLN